jgi:hypothetical protein
MDAGGVKRVGRDVEGIVEMMLDATGHYEQPLSAERRHAYLTGRNVNSIFSPSAI